MTVPVSVYTLAVRQEYEPGIGWHCRTLSVIYAIEAEARAFAEEYMKTRQEFYDPDFTGIGHCYAVELTTYTVGESYDDIPRALIDPPPASQQVLEKIEADRQAKADYFANLH